MDRQNNGEKKKDKRTNNDLHNTTQKAKLWASPTPQITGGKLVLRKGKQFLHKCLHIYNMLIDSWNNSSWAEMLIYSYILSSPRCFAFTPCSSFKVFFLCCVFNSFACLSLFNVWCPMLSVSLYYPFLIVPSVPLTFMIIMTYVHDDSLVIFLHLDWHDQWTVAHIKIIKYRTS